MEENDKIIRKKIFENLIIAVAVMLYFIIINIDYFLSMRLTKNILNKIANNIIAIPVNNKLVSLYKTILTIISAAMTKIPIINCLWLFLSIFFINIYHL